MVYDWGILDKEIVHGQLYKCKFYISSYSLNGILFYEQYKEILDISLIEKENQIVDAKEVCEIEIIEDAREGIRFQRCSFATVYKGNIIKNLIMDCQSYTKYRPNETTGGIFVSWRRKEELPTGA